MTSPTSNTASVPFALLMHDVYVSQDFDPYAEDDPEDEMTTDEIIAILKGLCRWL